MASECHACCRGVPRTPQGLGSLRTPLGTCIQCSSFACGYHGVRTTSARFICIRCDLQLQAACAGANGGNYYKDWLRQEDSTRGGPGLGDYPDAAFVARRLARAGAVQPAWPDLWVANLSEWIAQRPDYGWLHDWLQDRALSELGPLNEIAARNVEVPWDTRRSVAVFWLNISGEDQELLAASFVLMVSLRLPRNAVHPFLAVVAEALEVRLPTTGPSPEHGTEEHSITDLDRPITEEGP
jgi:hypothetical protein